MTTGSELAIAGNRTNANPGEVVEVRRYRLHPGSREVLIDLFDREFVESQEALGMRVIGQFRDLDAPNDFVWLRGFSSMPARAAALQAFYTGPVWTRHKDLANGTMINSDNVLLLRTVSPGKEFADSAGRRSPPGSTGQLRGLIAITVCYLAPRTDLHFAAYFETSIRPLLEQASARVLATLVTERSANTFPRLPVREGETVFVWLSCFPSQGAYEAHLSALAACDAWTGTTLPEMDRRTWRPNEVSRLTPTARSLLHG
jgi:hypothetical protein